MDRHHLGHGAADVVAAVRGVAALHSSDPVTPYLAARTRVGGFAPAGLDRELYERRTLWRLHAMRQTLFIVPADEAALFAAAAGRDIAAKERCKLEQWLAAELGQDGVRRWLAGVDAQVVEVLADGRELRTQDLTGEVSELGAGRSVPGTWARTETACSTATATPARPCGSMVASSAAGAAPRRRGGLPGAGGVGAEAAERVAEEAAALTDWLAGVVVASRFPTPLARELSG